MKPLDKLYDGFGQRILRPTLARPRLHIQLLQYFATNTHQCINPRQFKQPFVLMLYRDGTGGRLHCTGRINKDFREISVAYHERDSATPAASDTKRLSEGQRQRAPKLERDRGRAAGRRQAESRGRKTKSKSTRSKTQGEASQEQEDQGHERKSQTQEEIGRV